MTSERTTLDRARLMMGLPYSDEWYTPCHITHALGVFDLDPCAGPMNHAVRNYRLAHDENGLELEWTGRVWLNPPYSNIHLWLDKMAAHKNGVALVNGRSETIWFQRVAAAASAFLWLKGRVQFLRPDGPRCSLQVGQVLVAFGGGNADALRRCGLPGIFTPLHQ